MHTNLDFSSPALINVGPEIISYGFFMDGPKGMIS